MSFLLLNICNFFFLPLGVASCCASIQLVLYDAVNRNKVSIRHLPLGGPPRPSRGDTNAHSSRYFNIFTFYIWDPFSRKILLIFTIFIFVLSLITCIGDYRSKYRCKTQHLYVKLCTCIGSVVLKIKNWTKKLNSMVWVRERTIPTERPPLVGEVIVNFCG
jgi:hypothetical protein